MKLKSLYILFFLLACFSSCERSNCHNGIKDDDEIGVDCGGICPECPPTVETLFALEVTDTSAFLSMKYQGNTNTTFNSKGICFSTSAEPTIYDSYIGFFNSGSYPTDGDYEGYVRTLQPNTKYYLRGFVKDDKAIAYGNELSFTTNSLVLSLASVFTNPVTTVTQTTAISGGNITGDGKSPVTARGICYSSTTNNPTIVNTIIAGGSGLGSFNSDLIGLTPSTTYYVRAFATNGIGTAYGNPVSFKTSSPFRIGQSYGGGVIAYIDSTNFHGLIAAPADQSVGVIWSDGLSSTFATDTSIGTGNINTNKIVTNQGAGIYAASICQTLALGGYSDWYLPSKNELEQLYFNRALIGGFIDDWYWSSTEGSWFGYAMVHHFGNGSKSIGLVERQTWRVRTVRSF
tara:strand:- start:72 stop:1277 length:1206 start_codon:yes stop_codon:yes gene_type:complete